MSTKMFAFASACTLLGGTAHFKPGIHSITDDNLKDAQNVYDWFPRHSSLAMNGS